MAVVVISSGFCRAASSITASTVAARRSPAGRWGACISMDGSEEVSNLLLSFRAGLSSAECRGGAPTRASGPLYAPVGVLPGALDEVCVECLECILPAAQGKVKCVD